MTLKVSLAGDLAGYLFKVTWCYTTSNESVTDAKRCGARGASILKSTAELHIALRRLRFRPRLCRWWWPGLVDWHPIDTGYLSQGILKRVNSQYEVEVITVSLVTRVLLD